MHTACLELVEDPCLIHEESFVIHIFDNLADKLPKFNEYLVKLFEEKTSHIVVKSNIKAQPLKVFVKELFTPVDRNSQDSTCELEKLPRLEWQHF